jgi:hypothetical protein
MLESAHGWLGPGSSTLSGMYKVDELKHLIKYTYDQNLKCNKVCIYKGRYIGS